MLQHDEGDLKTRINRPRIEDQNYDQADLPVVVRKKKGEGPLPYADPFKNHIKGMEEKLKYGEGGRPPGSTLSMGAASPSRMIG
jgi:hypothetical protein